MHTFKTGDSSSEDDLSVESGDTDMTDSSSESDAEDADEAEEAAGGLQAGSSAEGKTEGEGEKQDEAKEQDEEEEEEDELVKAIKAAKEKPREYPPEISFEDIIVDISFHPGTNILAAGSVVGDVFLYKYENDGNELLETLEVHTKACRDIEFSEDGSVLYSCGKDKCIMLTDTSTGKIKKFYDDAHEQPLYSLYVFNENVICTGDEEGTVKIWDVRQDKAAMSFKHIEEFVSDMITTDAKKFLVCSSGDGTITSFNIPAKKMFIQSEGYEAELNCMQLMKYERKLLVCSSKGKMYLFNWGEFGYHSDEYAGPKLAINSVMAITENIVVAGYEDGNIRAVNLFPHRHLGVVGQHECSVESIDISHDGNFIASSSLDQTVRFWNIKYFEDLCVVKKKTNKKKNLEVNLPSSKITPFQPIETYAEVTDEVRGQEPAAGPYISPMTEEKWWQDGIANDGRATFWLGPIVGFKYWKEAEK